MTDIENPSGMSLQEFLTGDNLKSKGNYDKVIKYYTHNSVLKMNDDVKDDETASAAFIIWQYLKNYRVIFGVVYKYVYCKRSNINDGLRDWDMEFSNLIMGKRKVHPHIVNTPLENNTGEFIALLESRKFDTAEEAMEQALSEYLAPFYNYENFKKNLYDMERALNTALAEGRIAYAGDTIIKKWKGLFEVVDIECQVHFGGVGKMVEYKEAGLWLAFSKKMKGEIALFISVVKNANNHTSKKQKALFRSLRDRRAVKTKTNVYNTSNVDFTPTSLRDLLTDGKYKVLTNIRKVSPYYFTGTSQRFIWNDIVDNDTATAAFMYLQMTINGHMISNAATMFVEGVEEDYSFSINRNVKMRDKVLASGYKINRSLLRIDVERNVKSFIDEIDQWEGYVYGIMEAVLSTFLSAFFTSKDFTDNLYSIQKALRDGLESGRLKYFDEMLNKHWNGLFEHLDKTFRPHFEELEKLIEQHS